MRENVFSKIVTPPSSEKLVDKAFKAARTTTVTFPRSADRVTKTKILNKAKVKVASNVIVETLEQIGRSLPNSRSLHPFYRELLDIAFGIKRYEIARRKIKRTAQMIRKLRAKYLRDIARARGVKEAINSRKAFYGRAVSLLEDLNDSLALIRDIKSTFKKLPTVDLSVPVVVLAGLPNVGKSTIVAKISSAKPEIASYPFTTKEVKVGHVYRGTEVLQVVDTPGILDRPLSKRNELEKKAIAAIKHLADAILYVFDISEAGGYVLEQQLRLYRELREAFKGVEFVVALNKIDLLNNGKALQNFREAHLKDVKHVVPISALKGDGLEELVSVLFEVTSSRSPSPSRRR